MKKYPSEEIRNICENFLDGLKDILKKKLFGVYIYGGAVCLDSFPTGDIDFHVILREALTEEESREIDILHKSLAKNFPHLGVGMDGYYILLKDTNQKSPPKSQMWDGARIFADLCTVTKQRMLLFQKKKQQNGHIMLFQSGDNILNLQINRTQGR